ncbi:MULTISPECIES: aminotransferase class I/II-fold pyridoxal phosphate-dependent enzyme [Prochlorococcus]|uniref:aminotransferase class I/II-fold pyridoxal phosphate-dependent enzyme n=1 Tax=Prochlorococcus TaxID=1218 RepID=UPI0005339B41|nr:MULTISPECIES: 8-amino-7-oxononanoate synthase [Prochlorococcus]KGG13497.1 8-amino-7-oxononanoate synthase [Prochlorococcus sp. MIT 0601]
MYKIPPSRIRKLRTLALGKNSTELTTIYPDKEKTTLIDLASNDYLGLSRHPNVIEAANKIMKSEGVGSGGSRLLTGSRPIHLELENALSEWLQRESVLLFPSGFQANIAAVTALTDRNKIVIADRLIHHSLLVGVQASGARLKRFIHNDMNHLERILKEHIDQNPLVLTESLFSMEGTTAPIKKISNLCNQYNANLIVDEAHALGVMGSKGRGLCFEISEPVKIISGTFGKAFGSGGAFLASNKSIRDILIQTSGAFRYTTALAPPLAAAALEALNLIKKNPHWGHLLQKESQNWRKALAKQGWNTPPGSGPILSLIIGEDKLTLEYQDKLETRGLLSFAIRPPTVPEETSRLRLVLRKDLPSDTLEKLLSSLGSK